MTDLRIARLRKRYRLRSNALDERARLDRLLMSAMSEPLLDAAMERAGILATDEVCIRRVESFLRDSRRDPDSRLAVAWSVALADAIATRLREGGADVVRYASRHQALEDMAFRVARNELDRAWAWRQLDIWRADDAVAPRRAASEVASALERQPRAIVAVLTSIATAGLLPAFLGQLPAEQWTSLARAALVAADATDATIGVIDAFMDERASSPDEPAANHAANRQRVKEVVARVTTRSAIARAAARDDRVANALSVAATTALAALAFLESDPSLARAPLASHIVAELSATIRRTPAPRTADLPSTDRAGSTLARGETSAARPATAGTHDDDRPGSDDSLERPSGATAAGGVLFLLHIVRELDLPGEILANPAFALRSSRWAMHRLGLSLAPTDDTDPAMLAFAGLAPGATPPSHDEAPPTDAEALVITSLRDAVCARLRERLAASPEESDNALLKRVTSRRATIVADPAWIDVRLPLSDVTTEVRRAGLDLDLGWLPWLGVVMRFVYA